MAVRVRIEIRKSMKCSLSPYDINNKYYSLFFGIIKGTMCFRIVEYNYFILSVYFRLYKNEINK